MEPSGPSLSVADPQVSMELRRFRENLPRELPANVAARALGWSPSKLSRYEQARTPVTSDGLGQILGYYVKAHGMTPAHAKAIRAMFFEAAESGARHPYLGPAVAAPMVSEWAPLYVPRLLQVPAYAEAVLTEMQPVTGASPAEVAGAVRAVTRWQRRLEQSPPQQLHAVLDESVLSRAPGKPGAMAVQLEFLEQAADTGPVQVRVLPLGAAGAPRWAPAFRCLQYSGEPGSVRAESDELEGLSQPVKTEDGKLEWRRQLMFARLWEAAEPAGPVIRKLLAASA